MVACKPPPDSTSPTKRSPWRIVPFFALPVTALVLGLFYYWFAVADRYRVFLYYHDMGPYVPDTSSFNATTSSRYWMAGLVAAGAVMVLYGSLQWTLGRLSPRIECPAWWRVYLLCAPLVFIGTAIIAMTANHPTLPIRNAAQATAATVSGLSLALVPGCIAAAKPGRIVWLAADGLWLMLVMITLAGFQNLPRWLASGSTRWVVLSIAYLVFAALWLFLVTGLQLWQRVRAPRTMALFLAGLSTAYLLMPLVHHLLGTNGYFYISNSSNFFADSGILQLSVWLVAAALSLGVTRMRLRLTAWRTRRLAATVCRPS